MGPRLRKLALAVHLTCSVGWIGAVAAYLILDLTVASNRDPDAIRWAWSGMGAITERVIVPFALASVLTGLVVALGTPWGLFRHWWVLVSFLLTLFAAAVLLTEAGFIARAASTAADPATTRAEILALPHTLPHSIGGIVVLLTVQVLNVYKPRGVTPYGWRREQIERRSRKNSREGR
jgi:hypothetical protein